MLRVVKFIPCLLAITFSFQVALRAQDLKTAIRLTESEQFDAAHKAFDDLITKDPTNGEAYYYYGESWLKEYFADSGAVSLTDACNSALQYFNKGIEKVPGEPLNYIGVGRADILLGKYSEADASIQKGKDLMPPVGSPKYSKSAIPTAKQALAYAKIAEAFLKVPGKKLEDLLTILDNAVERNATVAEVYLIKGDIYIFFNDGSKGMAAYNKANYLDPTSSKVLVKIGMLNVKGHSYGDAMINFTAAISADSTFAPAYRERADLYGLGEQWENGLKDYNKFLELSGNNFFAKVRYASFLYMAKKYDDCIKVIEELKTTNKDAINKNYNFLNRLEAISYFKMDNAQSALEAIKTFFQFTIPEKIIPDDYVYYGDIHAKLGNHQDAIEKYLKATVIDTTNFDLFSKISKEYSTLKQYSDAIKYMEMKTNAGKATLTDYYDIGKLYMYNKDYSKADTSFGTVLEQKPDFINAVFYRAQCLSIVDSTETFQGLAKPWYDRLITLSLADSVKYVKYLSIGYDYERFYHYKTYLVSKKCEDAKKSIAFCDKVLAIDPKDEKALTTKKSLIVICP